MTRGVISDALAWSALEVRGESRLIPDGPKVFAGIHDGGCELLRSVPVLRCDELGILASQHHGACGIDGHDFRSALHVWQQPIEVCLRLRAQSFDISGLPSRHPATLKPRDALDI